MGEYDTHEDYLNRLEWIVLGHVVNLDKVHMSSRPVS
jgi:hypothetical protein